MGFINSFKDEIKFLFSGNSETLGAVAKFVQDNSTKPVIFAKGMPGDWDDDNNFVGGENKWK